MQSQSFSLTYSLAPFCSFQSLSKPHSALSGPLEKDIFFFFFFLSEVWLCGIVRSLPSALMLPAYHLPRPLPASSQSPDTTLPQLSLPSSWACSNLPFLPSAFLPRSRFHFTSVQGKLAAFIFAAQKHLSNRM